MVYLLVFNLFSMVERPKIFYRTLEAIKQRIREIDEELYKNTSDMRALDIDGDRIDDPQLYRLMSERALLEGEKNETRRYLGEGSEIIDSPGSGETVSLGHSVHIGVRYPDGGESEIRVTIGSTVDKKYLGRNDKTFGNSGLLLVSKDSPLAQVLLGKSVGDRTRYKTHDGDGEVTILDIEDSPLLK